MEEVIDLDSFDIGGSGGGDSSSSGRSVNFGDGIELLMNDKKRSSGNVKTQINLAELDNLENELNDLTKDSGESRPSRGLFDFGLGGSGGDNYEEPSSSHDSKLGRATYETMGNTSTWDGFSSMNDKMMDTEPTRASSSAGMSAREKSRKKRAMIKKINEWHEKGLIKNNPNFNMDTPFEEVEDEYETCLEDKRKRDSVKLYGWWFMTFVNTVEYANGAFNPFDLNLDGWGEQVSDDIDSYEEIFAELHEKYKGGKIAPELSLLLRLGFSAAMVNFTNKALSTATPGFNDVIRQSPELMKLFTNATVESMSKQSPAMGFMSNMMNQEPQVNTMFGRPPAPVETQGPRSAPPPQRPGNPPRSMNFTQNMGSSRPDLAAGRGFTVDGKSPMFSEGGVNMSQPQQRADAPERTPLRTPMNMPPAPTAGPPPQQQQQRREMSGPSVPPPAGIDDILANLKPTAVNIQDRQDDSLVSISSLKELQDNTTLPKSSRRRRKPKSEENSISLDI